MFGDCPPGYGLSNSGQVANDVNDYAQKARQLIVFLQVTRVISSIAKVGCCWRFVASYSFSDERV